MIEYNKYIEALSPTSLQSVFSIATEKSESAEVKKVQRVLIGVLFAKGLGISLAIGGSFDLLRGTKVMCADNSSVIKLLYFAVSGVSACVIAHDLIVSAHAVQKACLPSTKDIIVHVANTCVGKLASWFSQGSDSKRTEQSWVALFEDTILVKRILAVIIPDANCDADSVSTSG